MEMLSKHEVAQNVLDYFVHNKAKLQRGLESYDEKQGKGFVWCANQAFRPTFNFAPHVNLTSFSRAVWLAPPPLKF